MTNSLVSYLYPQHLETHSSAFNGEIKVYRFLGKYFISVDNLTQSGGLVKDIWAKALREVSKSNFATRMPRSVLILGLGAGTVAHLVSQNWPEAHLTGIDIDPVMIKLGKKYFHLNKVPNLNIITIDAVEWLKTAESKFDLILVDLYQGRQIPVSATTLSFIRSIKHHLTPQGSAIFNCLVLKGEPPHHLKFRSKLEKIFPQVSHIKTIANLIYKVDNSV